MATMRKTKAKKEPLVGILTGSPSDLDRVKKAQEVLEKLKIPCEVKVLSAHRTPDRVHIYVREAAARGIEVLIACAGMANHLGGAVAAQTLLPVIGVPLDAGKMDGLDALLSTVQMPPGVPVACVGVDNAKNAAYLAARILGIKHPDIVDRLQADLKEQRRKYDSV
jgi:5-(carboxyamino)imidazole ribonucleotide mutase